MATISLYSGKINNMPGLITDVKKSVTDYKSELFNLKRKSLKVNRSICNLDDAISAISTSTKSQEIKISSLEALQKNSEQFIADTARIDGEVADIVNQRKNDFYNRYSYLKPENEKNVWDNICDGLKAAGEWCKEHWKELLISFVVAIGAILAIIAVVCTGGMALAPMLAGLLTTLGMASGTALTVATVTSLVVAGIAITSTVASATLNLIDTWADMSENSTFQSWKNAINWTSAISNGFYSIGAIFNSLNGITNAGLREYSKIVFGKNNYQSNISTTQDTSVFWSGLGKGGDRIAAEAAQDIGKNTLEMTIEKSGITMPEWNRQVPSSIRAWKEASASFAWNSSGKATAFLGKNVASGSIWRTIEYPMLKINPNITSIVDFSGVAINYLSFSPLISGLSSLVWSSHNIATVNN